MVVSRDELENRRVAVIDDEFGGDALCLFDDATGKVVNILVNSPNGTLYIWCTDQTTPPAGCLLGLGSVGLGLYVVVTK